jgi:DNA-directed RNA polymerase alpha subunit
MPQYKVKQGQKGFFGGILYDSEGKRPFIVTDKPIPKDKIPNWVEPVKKKEISEAAQKQADAQKAKVEAAAAMKAAKAAEKAAKKSLQDADEFVKKQVGEKPETEVDQESEIASASFIDAKKPTTVVETL